MKIKKRFVGLLASLLLPRFASAAMPEFDLNAVLRFNLVCAHCHEGECSGRLSFSGEPEATYGHIRRFAGDVEPKMALHLHAILEYMKRYCAYAPMASVSSPSPSQAELAAYRDAGSGNYFIPIGQVSPGHYQVSLKLVRSASFRFEVVTGDFEPLVDARLQTANVSMPIDVEESTTLFLRLRTPDELLLRSVRLDHQISAK